MTFLAVLIVFLVVRWLGSAAPLQHDRWYFRWCRWLAVQPVLSGTGKFGTEDSSVEKPAPKTSRIEGLVFCLSLVVPLLAVFALLMLAHGLWSGLEIVVAVPVLLYSLGRAEFKPLVKQYIAACEQHEWRQAVDVAVSLGCDVAAIEEEDWSALSRKVLYAASYRGFERLFAVLFWFIALGAIGALMYRLSALYAGGAALVNSEEGSNGEANDEEAESEPADSEQAAGELPDRELARRWLWLIEWPAARLLGISFAVTGNFVGCLGGWRDVFWHSRIASAEVLGRCVEGALRVEQSELQTLEVSEKELRWMLSLYNRTLIFWMCGLAILAIAF